MEVALYIRNARSSISCVGHGHHSRQFSASEDVIFLTELVNVSAL